MAAASCVVEPTARPRLRGRRSFATARAPARPRARPAAGQPLSPRRRSPRTAPACSSASPGRGPGLAPPLAPAPAAAGRPACKATMSSHASSAMATRSPPRACLPTLSTRRSAASRSAIAQLRLNSLYIRQRIHATHSDGSRSRHCARAPRARSRASRAGIVARKRLPRPRPDAPRATRPAMPWKSTVSHTISDAPTRHLLHALRVAHRHHRHVRSIVVNG